MHVPARIMAAVTILHAAVAMAVATATPGPLLAVDDVAYLAMGRTLAGEGAAPLGAQPPYGVLYPVLLAPGWALGLGEAQMVTWGRAVNSLLGAALVPVLYLLLRRLTAAPFLPALGAAVIGASLPAAFLTGSIVWTERLLALLVGLAALLLVGNVRAPSLRTALGIAACAVALYGTHPRMGVVAVILVAAAAIPVLRHRRAAGSVVVALGVIGLGSTELLRRAVSTRTFDDTGTYGLFDLADRRGLGDAPEMAIHGGGTVAYLVLATAGLALIGVVLLWRSRELRGWYLALVGAVVLVSGWFLTGVSRSDGYLHGRYVEVVAPLLVALGVIGLRELPLRLTARLVVLSAIVSGLFAAWAGPGDNWSRPRSPVMMLGVEVSGAPFGGNFFEPGAVATVAIVVGLTLVGAATVRAWLPAVVAATVIAVGVFSGIAALDSLYDGSVTGQVQVAFADLEVTGVMIDTGRVPANVAAAVAWEVGLDHASMRVEPSTSHLLLPSDAPDPENATLVLQLGESSLWSVG